MKKISSVVTLCFWFLSACSIYGVEDYVLKPTIIKYYAIPDDNELVASQTLEELFSASNLHLKLRNDDRVLKRYNYASKNARITVIYFRQTPDVVRIALYKSTKLEKTSKISWQEEQIIQVFSKLEETNMFVPKETGKSVLW